MDKGIPFQWMPHWIGFEIKNGKFPMRRVLNIEMPCSASSITCSLEISKFFLPLRRQFFCRSGISESFFRLTYELEEYYATTQNPCYYHTYSVAIKGVLQACYFPGSYRAGSNNHRYSYRILEYLLQIL